MKRKFLMKVVMSLSLIFLISASPVLATTYNYDDLGRLTSVTYDSGQTITYSYDPAGNLLSTNSTNNTKSETLTVSNTTSSGITLGVNPALDGLQASDFMLFDDQNQPVTITTATTTNSGITYTISAMLVVGKNYSITATKSGYDFGTAQVGVPAETITETLTVSNTTSNGITFKSGTGRVNNKQFYTCRQFK